MKPLLSNNLLKLYPGLHGGPLFLRHSVSSFTSTVLGKRPINRCFAHYKPLQGATQGDLCTVCISLKPTDPRLFFLPASFGIRRYLVRRVTVVQGQSMSSILLLIESLRATSYNSCIVTNHSRFLDSPPRSLVNASLSSSPLSASFTLSLQAQNLLFQQILPTLTSLLIGLSS